MPKKQLAGQRFGALTVLRKGKALRKCKCCEKNFWADAGSDVYICPECAKKARSSSVLRTRVCQMCGAEIRYGRFCPECSAKLSRDNSSMVYVGEKPKHKMDYNGKMHTLDESEMKNVSRKPVAMRRKDKK